jgi:predicted RNA-binding protein Jag
MAPIDRTILTWLELTMRAMFGDEGARVTINVREVRGDGVEYILDAPEAFRGRLLGRNGANLAALDRVARVIAGGTRAVRVILVRGRPTHFSSVSPRE